MVNAAIVGLGWWGKQVVESFCGRYNKINFVRAVDLNPDPVANFCMDRGIVLSENFQDALDDPEVSAVVLCTPHLAHEEQIVRAAAAGKNVFCEKPLGLTRASAERSVTACGRAGVVLGIGHERRFEAPMEEIKRLIDDGLLGTIMHVESNFSHDKFVGISLDNWRANVTEAPAAGMTGMGIHLTDSYINILGPVAEVFAVTAKRVIEIPAGDIISVQFRFVSGVTGYLCAISATPYYGRFTVFGSESWVEVSDEAHPDEGKGNHLTVCGKDGVKVIIDYEPFDAVKANFEAFADAVEGRATYRFTSEQLIHNIATLEAIFKSAASGAPVEIY